MTEASTQKAVTFEAVITKKARLQYLLYVPKGYGEDKAKRWPLVLFLHGAGERGDDVQAIREHGLPKVLLTFALRVHNSATLSPRSVTPPGSNLDNRHLCFSHTT